MLAFPGNTYHRKGLAMDGKVRVPIACQGRIPAISVQGIPRASRKTNTARSSGESVSSTTSIAIETDLASATSSVSVIRPRTW